MSTFQMKQLDFLEKMIGLEMKRTVYRTYYCHCRTCNAAESYHTPEMAERFLNTHENHNTWIQTV